MLSIAELCKNIHPNIIKFRRDIHMYPEGPLCEYRTASKVVTRLKELGFEVHYGDATNNLDAIKQTLPSEEQSIQEYERAIRDGADPEIISKMKYGKTGVMGVLSCGEGPVVGIRCDMDAVYVKEQTNDNHIPTKEGFQSVYKELNHACGHDAHTAIGIGIAEAMSALARENKIRGTLKIFFEPAEEIFAGGRSMVDSGIADDLTHMIAIHMAVSTTKTGQIAASVIDFPKIIKYDIKFHGQNAHADYAPEQGKNALISACTAAVNLHAITRHSGGNSRINVGFIQSGSLMNLNSIPGYAELILELVAFDDEVFDFLYQSSENVIFGAAKMNNCTATIDINKSAVPVEPVQCDLEMVNIVKDAAKKVESINEIITEGSLRGAGEDASLFIEKAQRNGGIGTYIMFGSDLSNNAHTPYYDVDEKTLNIANETMVNILLKIMSN